jgi:type II secretion system protein N
VEVANLRKGLFYNFESPGITLKNESGDVLLSLDHFAGRMNPWPLVRRELAVSFQGSRDGGSMKGEANLSRKKVKIQARLDSLPLGELPSLRAVGLEAQGILNGGLRFEDRRGELRFSIRDLRLKGGSLLGLVMPVDLFSRANGAVIIDGNRRLLSSVSLEGRGIYARVKGEVADRTMDLQIEIMPDSSLLAEKPSSFSVMERFKVSPGYYVIPLKTRLPS